MKKESKTLFNYITRFETCCQGNLSVFNGKAFWVVALRGTGPWKEIPILDPGCWILDKIKKTQ
jgi:hypothetical protein